ncbi:MAG: hypothetical protein PHR06_11430, partial [Candidatus Cloacimonetes bacterium]|nr:hypothetical protein [Candidatus Cloacimonadota bacterium]
MSWFNKMNDTIEVGLDYITQKNYRVFLVLFLIIFGVYFKSIWYDYIFLDDTELIIKNHEFNSKWENIPKAFNKGVFLDDNDLFYRPILTISFIIDEKISGIELWGYHLSNIIYHIIASFLVLVFLITLGATRISSFLLSLIFAVHPVFVLAVAWVPGRNDILMTISLLLSMISFIQYLKTGLWYRLLFFFIFMLLSLFTKESSVMLIPLLVVIYFFLYRVYLKRFVYVFLITCWATVLFFIVRKQVILSDSTSSSFMNYIEVVWFNRMAVLQHLGNLFIPVKLSVMHYIKDFPVYPGIISLIFVIFILFSLKKMKIVIIGIFIYLAFLLPALINVFSMEHRLYFPSIGILVIIAFSFSKYINRFFAIILVIIMLMANIQYQRNFANG